MPRGGSRKHPADCQCGNCPKVGRKKNPLRDLKTGAITAAKILKQLNDEREIPELYKQLNPAQKLQTIFKLRDAAYGKPAVSEEQEKPATAIAINVNIRRVGS